MEVSRSKKRAPLGAHFEVEVRMEKKHHTLGPLFDVQMLTSVGRCGAKQKSKVSKKSAVVCLGSRRIDT